MDEFDYIPAISVEDLAAFLREGAVVTDGTWTQRFLGRLVDSVGGEAVSVMREALSDDEVIYPAGVLGGVYACQQIPRPAVAAALREVWLDHGLAMSSMVLRVFQDLRRDSREYLMRPDELARLDALPSIVKIYRGQLFGSGWGGTGMSWTLDRGIAEAYAASTDSLPRGWVLETVVPVSGVLAYFNERGEDEVVVDLSQIEQRVVADRGTTDGFPQHLAGPRGWTQGVVV